MITRSSVAFCASYYATVGRFSHEHGGRTTHTIEGIPRDTMDMAGFADQVRVLPELYELDTLKHDLTHSLISMASNMLIASAVLKDLASGIRCCNASTRDERKALPSYL